MTTTGCGEHTYTAGYNLDVKEARNMREHREICWKKIFEEFKANHEAAKAREAVEREAMQKLKGMTGHQRRTILARQENIDYQQRKSARQQRR